MEGFTGILDEMLELWPSLPAGARSQSSARSRELLDPIVVECGGDRNDVLISIAENGCSLEHSRQVQPDFLRSRARQQSNPRLVWIQPMLPGIVFTRDSGEGKFRQWMTDKGSVDTSGAIEFFFKWEDDHHAVYALLNPTKAATLPGPELRTDEIDDGNAEFFQFARETEVHVGKVDKDSDFWAPLFYRCDEAAVFSVDVRHVPYDLCDAHVSDIFGADDAVQTGGFHLLATEAEAGEFGAPYAKFSEKLGAVMVAAGFACGEEDARVGVCDDETSVDFSGGACMALSATKRFRAVLEPANNGLGWVIVWLPFDVEMVWKKMVRLRVKVEVGGEIFRTSLFGDAVRGGHFVLVNKKMQKAARAKVGAMVDFTIEPDLEEREAVMTLEFEKLLKREKRLAKWYGEQSESMQYEVGKWLNAVKSHEARQRRAEQMVERMLLTMEGEKVLPPVVQVAFHRMPAARKGWELLTVTQRRSSLLAIFYYQSPEAREKRVKKLVEDCLKAAGK